MTVVVVDALKIVDVQQHHRQVTILTQALFALQRFIQPGTGVHVGQKIEVGAQGNLAN
ncbi:hypothetical protein D3C78_1853530 [compost metagenome]